MLKGNLVHGSPVAWVQLNIFFIKGAAQMHMRMMKLKYLHMWKNWWSQTIVGLKIGSDKSKSLG